MTVAIRIARRGEESILANVAVGVFDRPLDESGVRAFLNDPRHHLALAIDDDVVVGFASAVDYVHPDRSHPELWINEIGVASSHQRRGLGTALLRALLDVGRAAGCTTAWVLTDRNNVAAMRLYSAVGGAAAPDGIVMFDFPLTATGSTTRPSIDLPDE